ncbi:50S ribosomal protein L5 [Candidatus Babeliales bacterium]|nr:50S ribosomal protein L5 [Candidatus Babeliales bacterium]
MEARLEKLYKEKIKLKLLEELNLKNLMQVPKISKIVLNMGVKDAVADSKVLNLVKDVITQIVGQAAVTTSAKKSIAGFKLREGMPIGVRVTLRRKRMYDFLDKFINIALPRVRDFHGFAQKFDGNGNLNVGIKDWMVFPEVDYDKVDKIRGLNVTIQTTAKSDEQALALLKSFNMPFGKE